MTVTEHLDFFASLKGCPKSAIKQEVENMIVTLGLETKRDSFSSTLSGGQKRKLSVGIALIGGSKTIILDEPTSGMDPAARRQTWDILQKFRKGRVMILSTHFMDEADLLGDRIAIMAEGVVKCCGTSLFLKKTFGAGYHLVIVKNSSCNVPNLTLAIQNHIPSAILESEISAELSYLLPFEESSKFEDLFIDIESRSSQLGISSFGASATTMEEVFFKVGEHGSDEGSGDSPSSFENLGYEDKAMNGRDHSLKNGIETANGTSAGIPMKNITNAGKFIGRCGDTCIEFNENYLAWELPGIGRYLIFMAIQGLVYLFLLFLIESGVINQFIYCMKGQNNISVGFETGMYEKVVEEQEDDDVSAERKRITNTPLENLLETDSLVIQGLSKQYGGYKAVDNISFGISNQECFGLLGQNGAGKTSTFKMLTGDLTVTSGNAYLHVYDIKQHLKQVQQNMGYCPQFDALIDQMTGRETLTMYARLRGVTEHQIKHVVNELLDVMTLRKYADKQCGQYRYLSYSLSLKW
ncbi:hypothetical protein KUTeg_021238 [Tegillarca granosa]|uniref:ABC transporter domain-containing protein n=1 Tax=Tegillarca granosa TaxID=220873 RepID=A0ABQ9ECW1_TEGGR|nr:hypothetical protein KUTeg_021238 [Tegillarca granosa]